MGALDYRRRYREDWLNPYLEAIRANVLDASVVLDIGSGRKPSVPRELRPRSGTYIGLDLSEAELRRAGPGAYDRWVVSDITRRLPELVGTVDVAVSWQVFEHVKPMKTALANIHEYLRPGGVLVASFSGRWSAFAVANRLLPHPVAKAVLEHLLRRDPETVFPAPYDSCTYTGMRSLLGTWGSARVIPRYRGATYFAFLGPLQLAYLWFEDALARGHHFDLATHYLVVAQRHNGGTDSRELELGGRTPTDSFGTHSVTADDDRLVPATG